MTDLKPAVVLRGHCCSSNPISWFWTIKSWMGAMLNKSCRKSQAESFCKTSKHAITSWDMRKSCQKRLVYDCFYNNHKKFKLDQVRLQGKQNWYERVQIMIQDSPRKRQWHFLWLAGWSLVTYPIHCHVSKQVIWIWASSQLHRVSSGRQNCVISKHHFTTLLTVNTY